MSEKPDYKFDSLFRRLTNLDVASEPGQSFRDVAISVETIGSEEPSFSSLHPGKKPKPLTKSTRELLQAVILKHSPCETNISADATPEERAEDRERRLNDKETRWRGIFFGWPRDPNGKHITRENSQPGKSPPGGAEIWGATLLDFYTVRRMPDIFQLVTFSCGSKLAAWMKANGEDYAKDALDLAKEELDPYQIFPYNITGLIQDCDRSVLDKCWVWGQDEDDNKGKGKEREDWQVPQPVHSTVLFFCAYINPSC